VEEQRIILHNGDNAALERDVTITDTTTWKKRTFDKLTVTDYYSHAESIYFITSDRLVFRHGFAIDLVELPSGGVLSKDKETLSPPLNAEETERVLKVYDLFKKY
jgi:hypothetical protein